MQENLNKLVEEKSMVISMKLKQIEREVRHLGLWMEHYFKTATTDEFYKINKNYIVDERGVFTRYIDYDTLRLPQEFSEISNVFIPKNQPLDNEVVKEIVASHRLEKHLRLAHTASYDLGWIYVITRNNLLRIYPFTSVQTFPSDHDFKDDIYYKVANEQNNPNREVVWTEPYYDWCGKGWTVTSSYPVYVNNSLHLQAVVSIDIPISTFKRSIEDFSIIDSGFAFILDTEGNIIYHPNHIQSATYKGQALSTNLLDTINNEVYRNIIQKMLINDTGFSQYVDDETGKNKFIAFSKIDHVNWVIGIEVNSIDFIGKYTEVMKSTLVIIFLLTTLVIVIGIYYFYGVSSPIISLANQAKNYSNIFGDSNRLNYAKKEVEILEETFDKMSITIKKYMEDLIKEKNKIDTVFNTVSGILAIRNLDYETIIINKNGLDMAYKLGKNIYEGKCYEVFGNREEPCDNCPIAETIKTQKDQASDVIINDRIYRVCSYPIFGDQDTIEGIVVNCNDKTEEAIKEQDLIQSEKLAGIGQIAAGITHELKNPISIIKGSHYLLLRYINKMPDATYSKQEFLQLLEGIEEAIKDSESIIFSLLDFTRNSSSEVKKVNIIKIIEQILILQKNNFIKTNIYATVTNNFEDKTVETLGNENALKQVFLNIIMNAIQAMPNGGKLNILITEEKEGIDKEAKIIIEDTGFGMPSHLVKKAFEPFVTSKNSEEGTGLGLWIAKNIIEKHKGKIYIESEENIGTKIIIILPLL